MKCNRVRNVLLVSVEINLLTSIGVIIMLLVYGKTSDGEIHAQQKFSFQEFQKMHGCTKCTIGYEELSVERMA